MEDFGPSHKNPAVSIKSRRQAGKQGASGHPQLLKYQVALKKISRRLDNLASHDLPDNGVLELLEDTRTQVLSLHLARKQLSRNNTKNKSKKRRHRG